MFLFFLNNFFTNNKVINQENCLDGITLYDSDSFSVDLHTNFDTVVNCTLILPFDKLKIFLIVFNATVTNQLDNKCPVFEMNFLVNKTEKRIRAECGGSIDMMNKIFDAVTRVRLIYEPKGLKFNSGTFISVTWTALMDCTTADEKTVFKCGDLCMNISKKCDGENNCLNKEDEICGGHSAVKIILIVFGIIIAIAIIIVIIVIIMRYIQKKKQISQGNVNNSVKQEDNSLHVQLKPEDGETTSFVPKKI